MITQKRLKEVLDYNHVTGTFYWISGNQGRVAGAVAGSRESGGYIQIGLDYKKYRAHRLVWLYIYGCFPNGGLDHINGICDDNRIENLREATISQNAMNAKMRTKNKSGYKGVILVKGNYHAQIKVGERVIRSRFFRKAKDAHTEYARLSEKYFGEFANHG